MAKKAVFIASVVALFAADRFSKLLMIRVLADRPSIPVVPDVFHLTAVHNTGAAFGLFRGRSFLLVAVTAVSVCLISAYVVLSPSLSRLQRWGWSMVVGGAVGNLYDRLTLGYVFDFLDFRFWPVFNLADTFVCIGVGLVFIGLWKR